eukprot:CAMPEP_0203664560 /NCGR_PEP_ID=MMETSP0090-20130426/1958_1 /ASSEMBLY_ACC=CAM_ASM_001088 /TAXON_ID=426623 /ORGANISM="Chaetoceros affinis, Strain CCMP159" /LENGTH=76 /DNA_ID=CAMNT_0050527855 /DNA_START=12 /DNA_END=242 /DNA_ORIENTATION=-
MGFKLLLFTHLSTLATGFYLGKSIDADELAAYRSASNDATSAWVKKILLGACALSGVGVVFVLRSGIMSHNRKALQ